MQKKYVGRIFGLLFSLSLSSLCRAAVDFEGIYKDVNLFGWFSGSVFDQTTFDSKKFDDFAGYEGIKVTKDFEAKKMIPSDKTQFHISMAAFLNAGNEDFIGELRVTRDKELKALKAVADDTSADAAAKHTAVFNDFLMNPYVIVNIAQAFNSKH